MRYAVTVGSPVLISVIEISCAVGASSLFIAVDKWIPLILMAIGVAFAIGLLFYLGWDNLSITFKDKAIVFPRLTILASDIKSVVVYENSPYCTIHFRHRKIPFDVRYTYDDAYDFENTLHAWALKNRVKIAVDGIRENEQQGRGIS